MFRALLKSRARMLFSDAIGEWHIAIHALSVETQHYYKRVLREFSASIPDKPINRITHTDIQSFLNRKLWIVKRSSANTSVVALKSFGRFLSEHYEIPNPAEKIKKFKSEPSRQPFINRQQYERILESATSLEADVIRLLACSGMRASELTGLEFENIHPSFGSVTFVGKGRKERTLPLNQTMREILSRHIKNEHIIKLPKSRRYVYKLCSRAGKRANLYLAPHMLRRFFASQLVEHGVSLLIVSRLLGHSSLRQTEIYLHLDSSFLTGSTDCLD